LVQRYEKFIGLLVASIEQQAATFGRLVANIGRQVASIGRHEDIIGRHEATVQQHERTFRRHAASVGELNTQLVPNGTLIIDGDHRTINMLFLTEQ
jgi:hypothetical protein